MPRDASGNFTLVSGNPVVSGTIITSDWANTTMPDLALGLQDSLDRFGRGGMEVPFKVPDGSGVAPGYAFVNEPSLGFYRAGAGQLGVAVGGAGRLLLSSTLWDSIVPMRLNAQNTGTQLTVKQGSAQTEAILRVISNDELTEYLAIDNAGQVTIDDLNASQATIDDLVVSNTPTIPGYATLGANTFTGDQTLSKSAPAIIFADTGAAADEGKWELEADNNAIRLRVLNDALGSTEDSLYITRNGAAADEITINADKINLTGTTENKVNGVEIATVGANTFTDTQVIAHPSTASLMQLKAVDGQNSMYECYEDGVRRALFAHVGAGDHTQISGFTAASVETGRLVIDSSGNVNVNVGQLQQGGVNVATVNTNWLLSDITDVTATAIEVNYTDGVTSAIQPQLNSKAPISNPTFTGEIGIGTVNVSQTELGILEGATLTTTEVNYVDGVTSAIQPQLNSKAPIANPTFTGEIGIGTVNVSQTELGILEGATLTTTELNYVDGVTSSIQAQLDSKAEIGVNTFASFGGYCNIDASTTSLPAGWTITKAGTGLYTVTHNLGLLISDIFPAVTGHSTVTCTTDSFTANSFLVATRGLLSGSFQDSAFSFVCTIL